MKVTLTLTINGEDHEVLCPVHHTLLEVLREECGLTGTKHGCELGECGACAVLIDGQPVLSCLALAAEVEDRQIETVEGLLDGNRLSSLQAALADLGAAQCGYCTPAVLLTAEALLRHDPHPARRDIEEALAGTLCRCTGYHKITEAVEWAAAERRGEPQKPPASAFFGDPEPRPGDERG